MKILSQKFLLKGKITRPQKFWPSKYLGYTAVASYTVCCVLPHVCAMVLLSHIFSCCEHRALFQGHYCFIMLLLCTTTCLCHGHCCSLRMLNFYHSYFRFVPWALLHRYIVCCVLTCFGYGWWYIIYSVLLCAVGITILCFMHCYFICCMLCTAMCFAP